MFLWKNTLFPFYKIKDYGGNMAKSIILDIYTFGRHKFGITNIILPLTIKIITLIVCENINYIEW